MLGTLTGLRVHNASTDDAAIMLGMNRLRSAYIALDPGIEPYLVTSPYDDAAGLMASYLMGSRRSMINHVLGSVTSPAAFPPHRRSRQVRAARAGR